MVAGAWVVRPVFTRNGVITKTRTRIRVKYKVLVLARESAGKSTQSPGPEIQKSLLVICARILAEVRNQQSKARRFLLKRCGCGTVPPRSRPGISKAYPSKESILHIHQHLSSLAAASRARSASIHDHHHLSPSAAAAACL